MKTAEDEVRELVGNLPDDASLEDIQYHLYVRQKIQRGLAGAEQGRTIPHEEVVRRMSRWLEKSCGRIQPGQTLRPRPNTSLGTPRPMRSPLPVDVSARPSAPA